MTPNQINFKQIRKFLLFTGVASCCIGMLEASQEVVKALESRNLTLPFPPQSTQNHPDLLASTSSKSPVAMAIPSANSPAKLQPNSLTEAQQQTQPSPQTSAQGSALTNPSGKTTPSQAFAMSQSVVSGQTPGNTPNLAAKAPKSQAAIASPTTGKTTQTAGVAATTTKSVAKAIDTNLRAINASSADDPQQPISQVAPTQISANSWYGASFPVENFQEYTSPFGYRYSPYGGYSQEFHYGLDFAAPEGSYIRNWWSGKVVEVSDNSNCGTSVVVESGDWVHIYCHMQGYVESTNGRKSMIDREGGVQIYEGQEIPAGSRIGRVGMTGRTTGPHLHWGLKYQEKWVDPALVLRAMYSSQQSTASR